MSIFALLNFIFTTGFPLIEKIFALYQVTPEDKRERLLNDMHKAINVASETGNTKSLEDLWSRGSK